MALVKNNAILTNRIAGSFLYYENVYVDVDHEGVEPSSTQITSYMLLFLCKCSIDQIEHLI